MLVHGLDKLDCPHKLHPPVAVLSLQSVSVEVVYILDCRQQTGRIGFDDYLEQYCIDQSDDGTLTVDQSDDSIVTVDQSENSIETYINKHWHEIVRSRNRLVLRQTEKIHDDLGDTGDATHLVFRHLEGSQPAELSLGIETV